MAANSVTTGTPCLSYRSPDFHVFCPTSGTLRLKMNFFSASASSLADG